MAQKKDDLQKLLKFIVEICEENGNNWFKDELISLYPQKAGNPIPTEIKDIYEYCIKEVITENAENFYKEFSIEKVRPKLIIDFIRMEQYRRENKFEDFCLALHQQLETIINYLCEKNNNFCNYIILHENEIVYKSKEKGKNIWEEHKLWELILTTFKNEKDAEELFKKPLIEWNYLHKLKAVLFYFYFDHKIWDFYDFQQLYSLGNDLYQARNLSHRGGYEFMNQQKIKTKVLENKYKYFFKFLGFLEDFVTKVNENISKAGSKL